MAYGLEVKNTSGLDLIDQVSKQVQIVKSGTVTPGSLNSESYYTRPSAPSAICPGQKETALLFCRPKLKSGQSVGGINPNFSIMWAQGRYTIRPSSTVSSGNSTFSCTITFANLGLYSVGAYILPRGYSSPTPDPEVDLIGQQVSGFNSYFSGSAAPTITSVTHISGTTYSVTFDKSTTSTMYSYTSTNINMDVAVFVEQGGNWYWNSRFELEYRFGTLTAGAEGPGSYGLNVYNGDVLSFSSNRENFQIENIVSGPADLEQGTGTGEPAYGSPVLVTEPRDVLYWEEYWALITGSGYCATICGAWAGSTGINTWGVGYVWCLPGNGCENKAITSNPAGGPNSTQLTHSSSFGIAVCPMYMTLNTPAPSIGYGGAYVQDDWFPNATRSLITGKFI